jgi:hypothetical protein
MKLWILSTQFRQIAQISNFMKIRPVIAEFSQADGPYRQDEANGCFSQYCERAQKKYTFYVTSFEMQTVRNSGMLAVQPPIDGATTERKKSA